VPKDESAFLSARTVNVVGVSVMRQAQRDAVPVLIDLAAQRAVVHGERAAAANLGGVADARRLAAVFVAADDPRPEGWVHLPPAWWLALDGLSFHVKHPTRHVAAAGALQ